ncbi:DUF1993 domain-containing protein [Alphaproteobacteria bacterium KMM 3653]|uniref:DUF1993 domain-containing protein n=1 Tax=Harenicola maris TaxID=2841044 RepID=A0AAP2CRG3_9RHOB|nr:DUF1993 domain-containing protein [Harenicola maris]
MDLYHQSVPVFRHYLSQAEGLVRVAGERPEVFEARLVPGMLTCAQQFASAAGFALRGTLPLIGRPVPEFPDLPLNRDGLLNRIDQTARALRALSPEDFAGAEARVVEHQAGFAELSQDGQTYLTLFALPNFFFHLSAGFALMRQSGLEVGKGDFDGLHDYPRGFRL